MSLSDLASIGSLLSGIAVVISLAYLAFQIRQNTRHQRASMQQGRAARTVDLLLRTAEPDMARAILRGRMGDGAIEPAELEHQEHVRGPLADAAHQDQLAHDLVVA